MVVMAMGPDYSIYMGQVLPEKLLPEIRAGIDKDLALFGLDKYGKSKALAFPSQSGILACLAVASYFWSSNGVAGPEQCKLHLLFLPYSSTLSDFRPAL
jgi:hypothetical protein